MHRPLIRLPLFFIGLAILAIGGCASQQPLPEGASACPSEPPSMCTLDYRPVQGFSADGIRIDEFSNHCRACTQEGVVYTLPNDRN